MKFVLLLTVAQLLFAEKLLAANWDLTSPNGQCAISVSLGDDGNLTWQGALAGKTVIQKSPLGLRRDDQDFEHSFVFDHAGKVEKRRQKYELFAGTGRMWTIC